MKPIDGIIEELTNYAINAAGCDETPEQQEWGATLIDAAAVIICKCGYTGEKDISLPALEKEADRMRENAKRLRGE